MKKIAPLIALASCPAVSDTVREDFNNWTALLNQVTDDHRAATVIGFDNNHNQALSWECSVRNDGFAREAFKVKVPNRDLSYGVNFNTDVGSGSFYMPNQGTDSWNWSEVSNLSFIKSMRDSMLARLEFKGYERSENGSIDRGITRVAIDMTSSDKAIERARAFCNNTRFFDVSYSDNEILVDGKPISKFCYEPLAGTMSGDAFIKQIFITRPSEFSRSCSDANQEARWREHEVTHIGGNRFEIAVIDGRSTITYRAKLNNVRMYDHDSVIMERISNVE
ncbi:hypothetical protein J4N45_14530 [Vibrio sp. SCSIO 43140]|uniref:hypothetical protein n=1 Tax=Vibrio sp. SCSIO 43140 TaxID=2819100 RepID=UPI002076455D|nr:hypothetical protein [Vibrio sp. SCSIO 43140]USD58796.1 hypothetical protein J4N45_09655 [Vibrio sp. SCSIO 43140]USD59130.1 hypothetical protein J4N45_11360 [Vibrio sp. SCSIO 43140]USD59717.1 hypothetical protein J4N45_14530 [Vibrio sp. SCSIO 43140]